MVTLTCRLSSGSGLSNHSLSHCCTNMQRWSLPRRINRQTTNPQDRASHESRPRRLNRTPLGPKTLHRPKIRCHNHARPTTMIRTSHPPPHLSILARHAILLVLVDPADGDAAVLGDEADELLRDVLGVVVLAQGGDVGVDDLLGGLAARLLATWAVAPGKCMG